MKIKLIERGEKAEQSREIPINQDEFLIGRGSDCDLRLPVSSISRHHSLIRVSTAEVTVTDLGSSNGTFLNGQRVRSQSTLQNGDEIQIGVCRFLVSLGEQNQETLKNYGAADPHDPTLKIPAEAVSKKQAEPEKEPGPSESPESLPEGTRK